MITKKLFIVVCVLASLYLIAQTQLVKNAITYVMTSGSTDKSLQVQIARLEANVQELELQVNKQNLLSRIVKLEEQLSNQTVQTGLPKEVIEQTSQKPAEVFDHQQGSAELVVAQSNTNKPQSVHQVNTQSELNNELTQLDDRDIETKKRLQQQAALRDLSQKLELLALDTLSNK